MAEPFANGGNGRDRQGRFTPGNKAALGRGNPHADRVAAWRAALADSVTADDIRDVVGVLVDKAKAGERWAVAELLDRTLGKAASFEQLELAARLEAVEARVYGEHTTANRTA